MLNGVGRRKLPRRPFPPKTVTEMVYIGIDTGTHTGLAVWDGDRLTAVETIPIHAALLRVKELAAFYGHNGNGVTVYFEDARLRKWYGTRTAKQDRARLQGAGSVKRDCAIWEEALSDWGIPFVAVAPKNNLTKMTAEYFRSLTGWTGRTSEHGRDAAMLVFGRK